MKLKRFRICLAVILLLASMIPIIDATFITIYPVDTNDDAYITGAGNYFGDTPFLPLRHSVTNFVIGTRFRSVTIPQGSKINNATLRVKSTYTYPTAGDIRVTITGDDADDSLAFNDSGSFSRTYTLAYIVWNISEVNGNTWAEVDVTPIIQEIVDRVGWVSGNSLSLVYFTDKGDPRREFSSIDDNPIYRARIEIFYNEETNPQDAADPPYNDTEKFIWEYNGTYRGIDIWKVWNTNRTGNTGAGSVNWRKLNLTQLTEIDSGAAITVNNASWASLSAFQAQQINVLYNDTGGAGVNDFFAMVAVNISAITNALGANWLSAAVTSTSTSTPVGGSGLLSGVGGNVAGVAITLFTDDDRYNFRLFDRSGVIRHYGVASQHFHESDNEILYIIYSGHLNWHVFHIYENPDFTGLLYREGRVYVNGLLGPFRYPQALSTTFDGTPFINTGEFYTFPLIPDAEPDVVLIYPNGTWVNPDPVPCPACTPEDIEDIIDDLLGGAQPEDPLEDEYLVISRFRWKLLVLAVGLIMMLGSPVAGILYGADTATWIKLLFVAFFGLGILWQIKFM